MDAVARRVLASPAMPTPDARKRRSPRCGRVPATLLALALLAPGCAPTPSPVPPPVPAPPPAPVPAPVPTPVPPPPAVTTAQAGYAARRDSLDSVDVSWLAGRRVVLDPGHGGAFPGTIGLNGLTEKEVNLGVALELRELLVAAGAEVHLTRIDDRDFVTPADSSLRADLAARVAINNAVAPDLFVSIHHNADPRSARDVNETQVYHRLDDDGASAEAATDLSRALARNLGIGATRTIPGNFFVVRGSEAPALLTEASYLSFPPTEERLRTREARRLEAESIFLGVARWFARRRPETESFTALDGGGRPDTLFRATPRLVARVRGEFDAVTLRLDGAAVPVTVTGGEVVWSTPQPLRAGVHEASFSARLATEGVGRTARLRFRLVKEPARLALAFAGAPREDGATFGARVSVLDFDGLPLPDSFVVRVASEPAGLLVPAETTVVARDGLALAYLRRTSGAAPAGAQVVAHFSGPGCSDCVPAVRRALDDTTGAGLRATFATRLPADAPLPSGLDWIDRNGFVTLPPGAGVPRLPGFRRADADGSWPPRWSALVGGVFTGRRIAIDPEGGGDDDGGLGADGTRGAALNLEVARALAAMLRAAGAQVLLTRDADQTVSERARVLAAEDFRAERYLRVSHAAAGLGHYWSSAGGRRWAQATARSLAALGLPAPATGESAKYPLTQASAVALDAGLSRTDSSETALLAPGRLRAEAYALFAGLAADLTNERIAAAPEVKAASDARETRRPGARPTASRPNGGSGTTASSWAADSVRVTDASGAPRAGVTLRLGDALVLATGPDGFARFLRTEPGDLPVEVGDGRSVTRGLLLESERGRVIVLPPR